jgi:hypothetical protein
VVAGANKYLGTCTWIVLGKGKALGWFLACNRCGKSVGARPVYLAMAHYFGKNIADVSKYADFRGVKVILI